MPRMSGGHAVVKALRGQGVTTLFALPGVQNDSLFNALYDEGDAIRVIHPRHEQGAAYMAYGYAQSTGRVGAYAVVKCRSCASMPIRASVGGGAIVLRAGAQYNRLEVFFRGVTGG